MMLLWNTRILTGQGSKKKRAKFSADFESVMQAREESASHASAARLYDDEIHVDEEQASPRFTLTVAWCVPIAALRLQSSDYALSSHARIEWSNDDKNTFEIGG